MASVRTEPYNGPWFTYPTPNEIIAAGTVLPTLGVIIVALRFYNRRRSSAGIGLDDWLVLPALVSWPVFIANLK